MEVSAANCPECGSEKLYKDGLRYLPSGSGVQRYYVELVDTASLSLASKSTSLIKLGDLIRVLSWLRPLSVKGILLLRKS